MLVHNLLKITIFAYFCKSSVIKIKDSCIGLKSVKILTYTSSIRITEYLCVFIWVYNWERDCLFVSLLSHLICKTDYRMLLNSVSCNIIVAAAHVEHSKQFAYEVPRKFTRICVPEALVDRAGVVQAEVWQRPAEICLMFLPCRAVTRVGSLTGLEWPRPSCNAHKEDTSSTKYSLILKYP